MKLSKQEDYSDLYMGNVKPEDMLIRKIKQNRQASKSKRNETIAL